MKVTDLVNRLLKPVALIALLCVVGTFAAAYLGGQYPSLDWLLRQLDLRHELNAATWFESALFLLCGLSFAVLGQKGEGRFDISTPYRYLFSLAALACVFASADEAAMIHERLGIRLEKTTGVLHGTAADESGYSWVLLYAPVVLTALAIAAYALFKFISSMPGPRGNRLCAKVFLLTAVIGVPCVLLFELIEGCFVAYGSWSTFFPCLEETTELVVLFGFTVSNSLIARSHEL